MAALGTCAADRRTSPRCSTSWCNRRRGPIIEPPRCDTASDAAHARPRRRARPAARPPRARDRCRRRRTTRCSSARPDPARRCSPRACPGCSRRSIAPGARGNDGALGGRGGASARRTHRASPVPGAAPHELDGRRSSVAARTRCDRARSAMSHCGVLFLDEIAEFPPSVLDWLASAAGGSGSSRVDRANLHVGPAGRLPARRGDEPVPVRWRGPTGQTACAAMRRCTAMRAGCPARCSTASTCASTCIARPSTNCLANEPGEPSSVVAERVEAARDLALGQAGCAQQRDRRRRRSTSSHRSIRRAQVHLRHEMERGRLSGRGYHRVRRVARTIADLRGDQSDQVTEGDVALALEFRASLAAALRGRAGRHDPSLPPATSPPSPGSSA